MRCVGGSPMAMRTVQRGMPLVKLVACQKRLNRLRYWMASKAGGRIFGGFRLNGRSVSASGKSHKAK